jgi:hypothetical protein
MSSFFDPSTAHMVNAVALAEYLDGLSDDDLRDAEEAFRLAAYGRPLWLPGESDGVQFKGTSRVIPWEIGSIIRSHRLHGTPFPSSLEVVAAAVAKGLTETEVAELEAQWQL